MASNGKLAPHEQGFRGIIQTLTVRLDVELTRNPRFKGGADSPDIPKYLVAARTRHGDYVEVGAAWEKTTTRGERVGEWFLSITVDDPSLDAPLNVTAFQRDGGNLEITWSRPRVDPSTFKPDAGRVAP